MNASQLLNQVKRFDAERPTLPGEHWIKLGTGLVLLLAGGRGSVIGRAMAMATGGALIYRAFNGRDGLSELLRREREREEGRRRVRLDGQVVASAAEAEPMASPDVLRDRLSLEEDAATLGRDERDAVEGTTRT